MGNFFQKLQKFWKKLGPGLITGISDDDPSGIATYSQAGAGFGLSTLWTALLTYPLMFAVQECCARIAIVTGQGLASVIRNNYSPIVLWATILLITPALILNIAANIAGMGAVCRLLLPIIPSIVFEIIISFFVIISMIFFSYKKITRYLKYLCLSLLAYFIVPFLIEHEWKNVLYATFIPQIEMSYEYISILVAILGTTISPYLFFWQSSLSLEHKTHHKNTNHKEIKDMKVDVNTGMFTSNLGMYFIILTTGIVLYNNGINQINTVEQAAEALKPLAGNFAYFLFSIGILGVGLLTLPVLSGCLGYIFAESFKWRKGLDRKLKEAKKFYSVIIFSILIGLMINIINIDPIQSLILTASVYGILSPFLIGLILHISNNKKVMGTYTNSIFINVLGVITLLLMTLSVCALFLFKLFY